MQVERYRLIVQPSRAEPSRAEPSRAEPSRAEPSRAERAEPSRAEPSRAEPSRAEPSRAEPSRAEPSRAAPRRAGGMDMRRVRLSCARRSSPSRGCPRPDARPGRARGRPFALPSAFALLAGALCLFPAAPAAAQDTILVSNLGQPRHRRVFRLAPIGLRRHRPRVHDGERGRGLHPVEHRYPCSGQARAPPLRERQIRAVLWAAESGGGPDTTTVANLTVPSSVSRGYW